MIEHIYTLGYTGLQPAQVYELARMKEALVVDVRKNPIPQKTTWQRRVLADLMQSYYVSLPPCGNENYKAAGAAAIQIANMEDCLYCLGLYADDPLHQYQAFILLCTCPSHAQCHRSKVALALNDYLPTHPTVIHWSTSKARSMLAYQQAKLSLS